MRIVILLAAIFLVSCSHQYPAAQASLTPDQAIYHLKPNDVVMLRVFDEQEMSGEYGIDSLGRIALPPVGKIDIGQQTEQQAAQTIRKALQKAGYLKDPKLSLEIAKARPVFVLGEVEKAGSFPFQTGMTVYQAVALAGGYTYRADHSDIILRRQTGKAGAEERFSAQEDTPLLPGDAIEIGERYF